MLGVVGIKDLLASGPRSFPGSLMDLGGSEVRDPGMAMLSVVPLHILVDETASRVHVFKRPWIIRPVLHRAKL